MRYTISVLVSFALVLTFAPQVAAQAKIFEFTPKDFAAGAGALFGEESETFDRQALFLVADSYVVKIPVANGSSGVSAEISFPNGPAGGVAVAYQLWNLNRADIPGLVGKAYGGTDFKFAQGGTADLNDAFDFDTRFVVGAYLGGGLVVEFYSSEEDAPISFALKYGF